MLTFLASPWNYIYKADLLEKDPHWFKKNVMGTGAFKFGEHVPGSHVTGKKNPDYFMKGLPYLDGFRALFIPDGAARVAALRGGRVSVDFVGASAFSGAAGELRFQAGILSGDLNGDRAADFEIALTGIAGLAASDMLL